MIDVSTNDAEWGMHGADLVHSRAMPIPTGSAWCPKTILIRNNVDVNHIARHPDHKDTGEVDGVSSGPIERARFPQEANYNIRTDYAVHLVAILCVDTNCARVPMHVLID